MTMDLDSKFAIACYRANLQGIKECLDAGADVNCKSGSGSLSSLIRLFRSEAPTKKMIRCLEVLLRAGAKTTIRESRTGQTPLIALCKLPADAHTALMVDLLLATSRKGIDRTDHSGLTALGHVCARAKSAKSWSRGDMDMVRLLLDWHADPNCGKYLPLIMAAEADNWRLATVLLQKKADPRARDVDNNMALPLIMERKSGITRSKSFESSGLELLRSRSNVHGRTADREGIAIHSGLQYR